MSPTTIKRSPNTLPTYEECGVVGQALSDAYSELEALETRVAKIVNGWEGDGRADDPPTLETIGMLAELVDVAGTYVSEIRRCRKELDEGLHSLMSMRADLELRAESEVPS